MIIKDLRILKSLEKKYKLKFDREFKYITYEDLSIKENRHLNKNGYFLKYFDGCFYPYLIKKEVEK
jgi:hypothetical protein|tara:strand:+ start:351 stop:548 length:198 start_codon:yes stop_codon:yes gene_type:complete